MPDPTTNIMLRRVRRCLRRIIGAAPRRQAHPLTAAEISRIVTAIDLDTAIGVRDRALLLLGYASALRPSKLAALHTADVSTRPGGLLVTVRRSKTDQDGYGRMVGVGPGDYWLTDPVSALADWLVLRPVGSGPLFTRIHPRGVATSEPIGVRTVSRMVQVRDRAAGMDGLPVSGHSLRASRADKTVKGLLIELLLGHVRLASTGRAGHQPGGRIMSRTAAIGVSQNVSHARPVV